MNVLTPLVLATLTAGAAVHGPGVARRLGYEPRSASATHREFGTGPIIGFGLVVLLLLSLFGASGRLLVGLAVIAALVVGGRRVANHLSIGRDTARRRRSVIGFCDALAAELRAGVPAMWAIERATEGDPELRSVAAAARIDADVVATLQACADRPGASGLRAVAAAWEVATRSGTALADVLGRVAATLRHEEDARAEIEAALAPPRVTARVLAVLPVFGLGLGASMGAHPVGFLLGTAWGIACCVLGSVLALLGVWWVERLAAAAAES